MSTPETLPTYNEIAEKAGVSAKTVCNVFRYPEMVRRKTAEKVLRALKQLGVKDARVMEARLRPKRATQGKTLLFLESGVSAGALSTPVYAKIIHGAEVRAHEMGWQFSLRHRAEGEPLAEALRHFSGEGVLLFGAGITHAELQQVLPGVAAVRLLASPEERGDCDVVDYDRQEVGLLAAQYLHQQGCQRVAYLGVDTRRSASFAAIARELGMEVKSICDEGLFTRDGKMQVVDLPRLRAAWKKIATWQPEGLFVSGDQLTNALYGILAVEPGSPLKSLRIVSCNAEEIFLSSLEPRPATIDIHSFEIGRRGIDLLLWRLQNLQAPPSSVSIRPKLLEGRNPQ